MYCTLKISETIQRIYSKKQTRKKILLDLSGWHQKEHLCTFPKPAIPYWKAAILANLPHYSSLTNQLTAWILKVFILREMLAGHYGNVRLWQSSYLVNNLFLRQLELEDPALKNTTLDKGKGISIQNRNFPAK